VLDELLQILMNRHSSHNLQMLLVRLTLMICLQMNIHQDKVMVQCLQSHMDLKLQLHSRMMLKSSRQLYIEHLVEQISWDATPDPLQSKWSGLYNSWNLAEVSQHRWTKYTLLPEESRPSMPAGTLPQTPGEIPQSVLDDLESNNIPILPEAPKKYNNNNM
jgi:hypothetical protein